MRRRADPVPFADEAAMCTAFMEWARQQEWTPYPETADFDVLLVHGDGTQIGVQAKMRFNLAVLQQIVPDDGYWSHNSGPDFRAVLVPSCGSKGLCAALGLTVFEYNRYDGFGPKLTDGRRHGAGTWHYLCPEKRCKLPSHVPDVIAGAPCPTRLTEWKIAALAIAAVLEIRGYVTRKDFGFYRIDYRRWTQDWLYPGEAAGQFVKGPALPDFAAQHPVVYPKVRAEVADRLATVAELVLV